MRVLAAAGFAVGDAWTKAEARRLALTFGEPNHDRARQGHELIAAGGASTRHDEREAMTLLYVDVSHHDRARRGRALDWTAIRSVTSPVMVARATYGDPNGYSPDTRYFAEFQDGARAAGFVLRGAYHNLIRGDASSMRRQVDWFRRTAAAESCHWMMVDVERYAELVDNGLWPRWSDVLRWRDAWYAADDRPIAWYLPQWLFDGYYRDAGGDMTDLPGPLIQSHYAGGDGTAAQIYAAAGADSGTGWDDTYGGRRCQIWQYTSAANVSGASGNTDVNAYRGSLDQLTDLLTGGDMSIRTDPDGWAMANRVYALIQGFTTFSYTLPDGTRRTEPNKLALTLAELDASIDAVAAAAGMTPAQLEAVKAAARQGAEDAVELALTPEALAAAIPDEFAADVVRLLGERQAAAARAAADVLSPPAG